MQKLAKIYEHENELVIIFSKTTHASSFSCKCSKLNPCKRQPYKIVKPTQTIRQQIADELFECV